MADEFKAKGNAAFSAQKYEEAIEHFTQAINLDGNNHVLYSNRSAALASLKRYKEAAEDANKCVSLKGDWAKGYSRLGAAYYGLGDWANAISAYEQGLKLDPANQQMKDALQEAKEASMKPKSPFSNPQILAKLATDPKTRSYLSDPSFMAMFSDLQKNPSHIAMYMNDPRMQDVFQVAFGLNMGSAEEEPSSSANSKSEPPKPASQPKPEPTPPPAPEVEMDDEEQEKAKRKMEALTFKEKGNELYKNKKFEEAIEAYNKALELYDEDISFLTNRAAVYFEMGEFEQCIADCDAAVEKGREMRADYKLVARALARKASALTKLERLEDAIHAYNKSLTEHRNADTLKKLNETEKLLKEKKEREYIDLELANQEKDLGNAAFKDMKYPEAVQHYSESLKRGPPSVNPEAYKLYSNLAACYTKLGAYPEGVKAADKCIELQPSFAKGYSRKGTLQFFMKEYEKALETYQRGLEFDKDNEELREGMVKCVEAINRLASGQASAEELKESQSRAMQDPEIQAIMMDPVMQQVLRDLSTDYKNSQQHLKNPSIAKKLNKLVSAGIVQLK